MPMNTERLLPWILAVPLLVGLPTPGQADPDCADTRAAQILLDTRESARESMSMDAQAQLDQTTGDTLPEAVQNTCIERIMENGLGAQISLPTISGLLSGLTEDAINSAIDAFCEPVDDTIDTVVDTSDGTAQRVPIADVGVDEGDREDSGVGVGTDAGTTDTLLDEIYDETGTFDDLYR